MINKVSWCTISIFMLIHNSGCHHGVTFEYSVWPYLLQYFYIGYTTVLPPDFKLQDDGSSQAINALTAVHG